MHKVIECWIWSKGILHGKIMWSPNIEKHLLPQYSHSRLPFHRFIIWSKTFALHTCSSRIHFKFHATGMNEYQSGPGHTSYSYTRFGGWIFWYVVSALTNNNSFLVNGQSHHLIWSNGHLPAYQSPRAILSLSAIYQSENACACKNNLTRFPQLYPTGSIAQKQWSQEETTHASGRLQSYCK